MDTSHISEIFGVLKNETRLAVLEAMKGTTTRKGLRECEIATDLEIGQSHTAQCIRKLVAVGMIERHDDLQHSPYSITKLGKTMLSVVARAKGAIPK